MFDLSQKTTFAGRVLSFILGTLGILMGLAFALMGMAAGFGGY